MIVNKMKYIQIVTMGLAISLAPVAAISNNFWVIGILLNVGVTAAAMWATFDEHTSTTTEARIFSTLLWGGLALQLAWAIVAHA